MRLLASAFVIFSLSPVLALGNFDPRTMTLAEVEAATGIQGEPPLADTAGFTIAQPGTYENMNVRGRITITSSDVTLRNNRITGDEYYAVLVDPRHAPGGILKNVVIENNDISGSTNCIAGNFAIARRNDISKCDNGFNVWGLDQEIIENYIHLGDFSQNPDSHFDGIENNGASGMRAVGNYIVLHSRQTSAIMLNNQFGSITDAVISGNFLAGGGYTIYCDNRKSRTLQFVGSKITIRSNSVKPGLWGPIAAYTSGCVLNASNKLVR